MSEDVLISSVLTGLFLLLSLPDLLDLPKSLRYAKRFQCHFSIYLSILEIQFRIFSDPCMNLTRRNDIRQ